MPNFVCKKLSKLEFPASINGCEFKSYFEELRDEKNTGNLEEAQKQIQKILKDNNLMDEDLKGIKIDFIFN